MTSFPCLCLHPVFLFLPQFSLIPITEASPGSLCSASTFAFAHNAFCLFVCFSFFFLRSHFFQLNSLLFLSYLNITKKKKSQDFDVEGRESWDNSIIDTRSKRWRFIAVSYLWKTRNFSVSLAGSDSCWLWDPRLHILLEEVFKKKKKGSN